MSIYLLDSNVLSDVMRNPGGHLAIVLEQKTGERGARVLTSIIVACEMHYGAFKQGSSPLTARVASALGSLEVVPLSGGVEVAYASLRCDLERKGQVIGQNDMLIAAHAIALGAVLVTDNVREFQRVKGLRVENWLRS
jgi:tRNA(fMet)-specific endonuclease VapC